MYISLQQLEASLPKLDPVHPFLGISFLAFKLLDLKVNDLKHVDIADQERSILEAYYNPRPESKSYYIPLRSTGPVKRWVSKVKYPDSGLQKTRTTSFIGAFLHPSNSDEWAWSPDYLSKLTNIRNVKVPIPTFHLAVWMLRDHNWPENTQAKDIIEAFFEFFHISEEEKEALFDTELPQRLFPIETFQREPITWKNLRGLIDAPPDEAPDEGGALETLELIGIGPAKRIDLDLAQRLNIITGDNGLGKTFLLECAWWALSGHWADPEQPAYPRPDSIKPSIKFQISGSTAKPETISYNRANQTWPFPNEKRPVLPGIVIYLRVDGSCVIWDPAKHYWSSESDKTQGLETADAIRLSSNNTWNGLERDLKNGGKQYICNGLVRDWVTWQYIPPTNAFDTFSRVLQKLSPSTELTLIPGQLTKLPRDTRDMPTLKLPYDDVPIVLLSAGIKRILSMAYLLVWTWETHKEASKNIGKPPQSKIVFVVDEMEAHLHPKWQRVIVPALLDVVKELEKSLEIQLIIATHSPLVLASIEPIFNEKLDKLFTLDLIQQELEVREIAYIKRGSINSWLTSEIFDLKRAYSVEAEIALVRAKNLQTTDQPDPREVKEVSNMLLEHLPPLDPFWARWKFFAEKYGVDL
jgi:AAA domain, putative AbiEii toxin, Type IV TA system